MRVSGFRVSGFGVRAQGLLLKVFLCGVRALLRSLSQLSPSRDLEHRFSKGFRASRVYATPWSVV